MKRIITMVNPHFKMIKFIRLLFYHIYMYYDKSEKLGKTLTKFSTFCVFIVLCSFLIITIYDLVCQYYNINYTSLSGKPYVIVCIVIGIIIAYYLYKENFEDFNEYYDYNEKYYYYYYFFSIVLVTLCLVIYTGKISRKRVFEQREIEKERIENGKNNIKIN